MFSIFCLVDWTYSVSYVVSQQRYRRFAQEFHHNHKSKLSPSSIGPMEPVEPADEFRHANTSEAPLRFPKGLFPANTQVFLLEENWSVPADPNDVLTPADYTNLTDQEREWMREAAVIPINTLLDQWARCVTTEDAYQRRFVRRTLETRLTRMLSVEDEGLDIPVLLYDQVMAGWTKREEEEIRARSGASLRNEGVTE